MVGDSQKKIVDLLQAYFQQLNAQKHFNWLDGHVHAEYFFKDLFNLIYGYKLKHVGIKGNPNAEGIDLFSDEDELVIQITGQSTNIKNKVSKTLEKYERTWKPSYKSLVIFFINPGNEVHHNEKASDNSIVWTGEGIIKEIINLPPDKRDSALDFLLIELTGYNNKEKHLKAIKPFEIEKQANFLTIAPSEFDEVNDLLFYLNTEIQIVDEIVNSFLLSKSTDALLTGPPCIGKTTLILLLNKRLREKLIKVFYYDNKSNYDVGTIDADINRIRSHDCVLVIDNAYQDDELALKILKRAKLTPIRTLFISRNREIGASNKIENFIQGKIFRLKEPSTKDFEYKAKGIINKRIRYLRRILPEYSWSAGNIGIVLISLERNLLRLSMKLFQWVKQYPKYSLDQIEDSKLIESFLDTQINLNTDEEVRQLYLYSFLYKIDYQFYLMSQNTFTTSLINNGTIIAQNPSSRFYSFYHTEYANLIYKGIQQKHGYTTKETESLVIQYIIEQHPPNINALLNKLISQNEFIIVKAILVVPSIRKFLSDQYSPRTLLNDLIVLIEYCTSTRDKELKEFVNDITTNENLNIPIHEKDGEKLYLILKSTNNWKPKDLLSNRDVRYENIFKSNSFYNLTHFLKYKSLSFQEKSAFIQSFSFTEWLILFNTQKTEIGSISGGLSNLVSLPHGKQLAYDLYDRITIDEIFNSIKSAEIDVIGKSLSELNKLNPFETDNKTRKVLKLLIDNGYLDFRDYWGLTKFAIAASHLSAIQTSINEMFPSESSLKKLFQDISASEIANQVFELVKAFPERRDLILRTLEDTINSEGFLINPKNNLAGLFILKSLLEKLAFQTPLFQKLSGLIEDKITHEKDVVIISNSFKKFKKELRNLKIEDFINSNSVSNYLRERKQFGSLETIFSNLNSFFGNRKFSSRLLKEIPIDVISISMKHPNINIESISKVMTILNGIDSEYTENVFENSVNILFGKMKVASMSNQILAYSRLHKINPKTTEKAFGNLLVEEFSKRNFEGESLSMLFQAIRKLATISVGSINYKALCHSFLERNKKGITTLCGNLDLAKISTGLRELASVFPDISKNYLKEIEHLILEKVKSEGRRDNFTTQIIPELRWAGANAEFINQLNAKVFS
jgi:hypothetical protein